ncbi:MAG: MerR family DNA-binding transcriptional regulator [Alphaproteobacteria bacterium]
MHVKDEESRSRKNNTSGSQPQLYSIGDLASEFDISTRAIRFYESKGLIGPERAGANRIFTRRDRARLILILRGKRLGFSLSTIAEYLDLYDADPDQAAQTRLLLEKVETAIASLENKRQDIDKTLTELAEIRKQCLSHAKL